MNRQCPSSFNGRRKKPRSMLSGYIPDPDPPKPESARVFRETWKAPQTTSQDLKQGSAQRQMRRTRNRVCGKREPMVPGRRARSDEQTEQSLGARSFRGPGDCPLLGHFGLLTETRGTSTVPLLRQKSVHLRSNLPREAELSVTYGFVRCPGRGAHVGRVSGTAFLAEDLLHFCFLDKGCRASLRTTGSDQ